MGDSAWNLLPHKAGTRIVAKGRAGSRPIVLWRFSRGSLENPPLQIQSLPLTDPQYRAASYFIYTHAWNELNLNLVLNNP